MAADGFSLLENPTDTPTGATPVGLRHWFDFFLIKKPQQQRVKT